MRKIALGWLLLVAVWVAPPPAAAGKLVVYAARKIITMDPDLPRATAVAVADGRIVDLGSINSVTSSAGPDVRIDHTFSDLILMPGFVAFHESRDEAPPSASEDPQGYLEALRRSREPLHRGGLTTVADQGLLGADPVAESELIEQVYARRDTPFRTVLFPDGTRLIESLGPKRALALMKRLPARSVDRVKLARRVKLVADTPEGEWRMEPEELESAARLFWRAGWPIHVQVNRDRGVAVVLDMIEELIAESSGSEPHFVLHQLGYATDAQAQRIAELGAWASANPYLLWVRGDVQDGPPVARMGALARRGVPLSFHSDLAREPSVPLRLAWVAANRIDESGELRTPRERISVDTALRAITIEAARALGMEEEIGSITPGKSADFTVLEKNPYGVAPEELKDIPIWGTVFEGRPYPFEEE